MSLSSSTGRVSLLESFASIKSLAPFLFQGFSFMEPIGLPRFWRMIVQQGH